MHSHFRGSSCSVLALILTSRLVQPTLILRLIVRALPHRVILQATQRGVPAGVSLPVGRSFTADDRREPSSYFLLSPGPYAHRVSAEFEPLRKDEGGWMKSVGLLMLTLHLPSEMGCAEKTKGFRSLRVNFLHRPGPRAWILHCDSGGRGRMGEETASLCRKSSACLCFLISHVLPHPEPGLRQEGRMLLLFHTFSLIYPLSHIFLLRVVLGVALTFTYIQCDPHPPGVALLINILKQHWSRARSSIFHWELLVYCLSLDQISFSISLCCTYWI